MISGKCVFSVPNDYVTSSVRLDGRPSIYVTSTESVLPAFLLIHAQVSELAINLSNLIDGIFDKK